MHPRTEEVLRHLDASHAVLRAAVDDVPVELRETRPAGDRWSVAEVLEHLATVEVAVTRLLSKRLGDATGRLEPERDTSSVLASFPHGALLDRTRRLTAGERVTPRGELSAAPALATLEDARRRVRELAIAHDGLAIGALTHSHPVLGELDLYRWLVFVGSHEQRHADQIREIGRALQSAGEVEAG